MSFLLLENEYALLLDAGSGVGRLVTTGIREMLKPYDCLHVLLSHYHIDHVVGISCLPETWPGSKIKVLGPTRPCVDASPRTALGRLLSPPLFSTGLTELLKPVEIIPFANGAHHIDGLNFLTWPQKRPCNTSTIIIKILFLCIMPLTCLITPINRPKNGEITMRACHSPGLIMRPLSRP